MDAVSLVGLGKLGQGLAVCLAHKGISVLGVDVNDTVVEALNAGVITVIEPQLQDMLKGARGRLRASVEHASAIAETDTTLVLVSTPSRVDGDFSTDYVRSALEPLARALADHNKADHLFVVCSTIMPGSLEQEIIPLLETESGRRLNDGFRVCYCPELVALGSVAFDFLNPDFVVIGESSPEAGQGAANLYRKLCDNDPPFFYMSLTEAEIAKLALNCYITTKISFANLLASLCERIPGTDVDRITAAIGHDRRIGTRYFRGGLSYGGPCFPRDTKALRALLQRSNIDASLLEAVERVNETRHDYLLNLVLEQARRESYESVGILGLAFKPGTDVTEKSPGIVLLHSLLKHQLEITVYDPLVISSVQSQFGDRIHYAQSAGECLSRSGICVLTTPDPEFSTIGADCITYDPTVVIDCWRIIDPAILGPKARHIPIGRAV